MELCRQFGISRPTGYTILSRYEKEGWEALEEGSRRPAHSPTQISSDIEQAILAERSKHPRWGARKLLILLERARPEIELPCESTVNNILKRHGMVTPRRKNRRKIINKYPQFDPQGPNLVWSADFKGKFRMGNWEYCNPLTIADSFSRYLFAIHGLEYCRAEDCKPIFEKAFREFGMPEQIHTDNGPPFGSPISLRRLTHLATWFMDLGVTPVYSDPGQPQQNGRHERMHKDLKAEATRPPGSGWRSQQRKLDHFRKEYNEVRPHEALMMKTPSEVHTKSVREYPRRVQDWSYPKEMQTKLVTVNGALRWKTHGQIMVSTALSGRDVGLEPVDDGIWIVYYRHVALGVLSERTQRVYELEEYRL
ncbi:MAG: integrase core domain-containing protein [Ktedonobacteraceae bacterium]